MPLASVICSATSDVARKGISKFVASGYIKETQITDISWRLHKVAVLEIKINVLANDIYHVMNSFRHRVLSF